MPRKDGRLALDQLREAALQHLDDPSVKRLAHCAGACRMHQGMLEEKARPAASRVERPIRRLLACGGLKFMSVRRATAASTS